MTKQAKLIDTFFKTQWVYHVRITDDDVDLQDTYNALTPMFKYVIVAQEGGPDTDKALHHHCLVAGFQKLPDELLNHSEKKQRQHLKDVVKAKILHLYPNATGPGHSIVQAKNKKVLASYVLKGENYMSKGFTQEFIDRAIVLSYDQSAWKKKYQELREQLFDESITLEHYSNSLLELKAEAGQPIAINHHQNHILKVGS
jgi:hypothetical protein